MVDDENIPAEQVKSLNRRWKESGMTQPFKDFLEVYNTKKAVISMNAAGDINSLFGSVFTQPSAGSLASEEAQLLPAQAQVSTQVDTSAIFGIPGYVFIIAGVLIFGGIIYVIIKRRQK